MGWAGEEDGGVLLTMSYGVANNAVAHVATALTCWVATCWLLVLLSSMTFTLIPPCTTYSLRAVIWQPAIGWLKLHGFQLSPQPMVRDGAPSSCSDVNHQHQHAPCIQQPSARQDYQRQPAVAGCYRPAILPFTHTPTHSRCGIDRQWWLVLE